MDQVYSVTYTAFEGSRCIASGELASVVLQAKRVIDLGSQLPVLIFNDSTCEQIELDYRGTEADFLQRLPAVTPAHAATGASIQSSPQMPNGPGRPKLGVVAREVTLLPRHWEWLNSQPGGASVALRKLVEQARHTKKNEDRLRLAQEATYRFISVMAGDLPGFEEATRALFAKNREYFAQCVAGWPVDVREYSSRQAALVFQEAEG